MPVYPGAPPNDFEKPPRQLTGSSDGPAHMSCAVESSYGFRSRAQVVCNQCPTRAAKSESADSSVSLISLHRSAAAERGCVNDRVAFLNRSGTEEFCPLDS